MLLPYADAEVQLHHYIDARNIFEQIDQIFDKSPATNPTDELDHLRAKTNLAWLAFNAKELESAFRLTTEALDLIDRYESFTALNYYKGLMLQLRANIELERAMQCDAGPRYFIVGMGTYTRKNMHESFATTFEVWENRTEHVKSEA